MNPIWNVLQIAPTRDEGQVRRAYARQLKTRQHEGDAALFAQLRNAYEAALELCRQNDGATEPEHDAAPDAANPVAPDALDTPPVAHAEGETPPAQDPLFASLNEQIHALGTALQHNLPDMLLTWQSLLQHPLMQRLDVRERVAEVLADLLASHWPHSRPVWSRALTHFGWEIPTRQDDSQGAHALRWLFEQAQGDESRRDALRDAYLNASPNPFEILQRGEAPWMRYTRFALSRGERSTMRRFLGDLDALGGEEPLHHNADAEQWWRQALVRPMLSKRHLLPVLCMLALALLVHEDPYAWLMLTGSVLGVGLWHGARVFWHRWRKDPGPLVDPENPSVMIIGAALCAVGVLVCGMARLADATLPIYAGVMLLGLSVLWVRTLTSLTRPLAAMNDKTLLSVLFCWALATAGFASALHAPRGVDLLTVVVYGACVAFWLMIVALPLFMACARHHPVLLGGRIAYGIAGASAVLLGLHGVFIDNLAITGLLNAFDALLLMLAWAAISARDWSLPVNSYVLYFVSLVGFNVLADLRMGGQDARPQVIAALLSVALGHALSAIWQERRWQR